MKLTILAAAIATLSAATNNIIASRQHPRRLRGASPTGDFLWLTDFHYDAFYDGSLGSSCFCNKASISGTFLNASAADAKEAQCAVEGAANVNPFGKKGCDSSLELIRSVIAAAAKVNPNPAFILVTGDYTRHNTNMFRENSTAIVQEAISTVTELLASHFPSQAKSNQIVHLPSEKFEFDLTPVIGSFGNNDFPLDYGGVAATDGNVSNPYFKLTKATFTAATTAGSAHSAAKRRLLNAHSDSDSFEMGGYTVTAVSPTLSVINLNTIPYSPNYDPTAVSNTTNYADPWAQLNTEQAEETKQVDEDPYNQFKWLESTLQKLEAEGRSAYITGHIPPSLDTYKKTLQWREEYIVKYEEIVMRYISVVKGQLFGHVHKDEWRVHPKATGRAQMPPFLIAGAVTPIYQNNPSFRFVQYNEKDGAIKDWKVYYAELSTASRDMTATLLDASLTTSAKAVTASQPSLTWVEEYNAQEEYGLSQPITNTQLNLLTQRMFTDNTLWETYYRNVQAQWPGETPCVVGTCRVEFLCALQSFSDTKYDECLQTHTDEAHVPAPRVEQKKSTKYVGGKNLRSHAGGSRSLTTDNSSDWN